MENSWIVGNYYITKLLNTENVLTAIGTECRGCCPVACNFPNSDVMIIAAR